MAPGGGVGAVMRYSVLLIFTGQSFPYATMMINLAGSFLLGILMAFTLRTEGLPDSTRLFVATGICGGFTTFSGFSGENFDLLQSGKYNLAFLYIAMSVVGGILAAWLGLKLFQR